MKHNLADHEVHALLNQAQPPPEPPKVEELLSQARQAHNVSVNIRAQLNRPVHAVPTAVRVQFGDGAAPSPYAALRDPSNLALDLPRSFTIKAQPRFGSVLGLVKDSDACAGDEDADAKHGPGDGDEGEEGSKQARWNANHVVTRFVFGADAPAPAAGTPEAPGSVLEELSPAMQAALRADAALATSKSARSRRKSTTDYSPALYSARSSACGAAPAPSTVLGLTAAAAAAHGDLDQGAGPAEALFYGRALASHSFTAAQLRSATPPPMSGLGLAGLPRPPSQAALGASSSRARRASMTAFSPSEPMPLSARRSMEEVSPVLAAGLGGGGAGASPLSGGASGLRASGRWAQHKRESSQGQGLGLGLGSGVLGSEGPSSRASFTEASVPASASEQPSRGSSLGTVKQGGAGSFAESTAPVSGQASRRASTRAVMLGAAGAGLPTSGPLPPRLDAFQLSPDPNSASSPPATMATRSQPQMGSAAGMELDRSGLLTQDPAARPSEDGGRAFAGGAASNSFSRQRGGLGYAPSPRAGVDAGGPPWRGSADPATEQPYCMPPAEGGGSGSGIVSGVAARRRSLCHLPPRGPTWADAGPGEAPLSTCPRRASLDDTFSRPRVAIGAPLPSAGSALVPSPHGGLPHGPSGHHRPPAPWATSPGPNSHRGPELRFEEPPSAALGSAESPTRDASAQRNRLHLQHQKSRRLALQLEDVVAEDEGRRERARAHAAAGDGPSPSPQPQLVQLVDLPALPRHGTPATQLAVPVPRAGAGAGGAGASPGASAGPAAGAARGGRGTGRASGAQGEQSGLMQRFVTFLRGDKAPPSN
ncbi:hypothetical protein HYH03_002540 [Edaphochlamys debaryana]|uniref:Uncharacterized protein n=1 Tax=Edaphochlamys debaryana TaxID=47281 RepID=A0A836C593_9CHLO|nr:hypothetical protein HYH03_002540 [Edaphochlamys debaryana]|eukprot:KAG2499599.1 hypothetical protein HYH03_002540 [Edaphochlamys debaryana]